MPFDRGAVERSLERLSPERRLAFAAATCERLLPAYDAFVRESGWGDPLVMREAVKLAWGAVRKHPVEFTDVAELQTRCQEAIPDSEDFGTTWAAAAIDTGSAVYHLLECVLDPSSTRCAAVAAAAHEGVDLYVQALMDLDANDRDYQAKIDAHPVMKRERERAREDLDLLLSWTEVDDVAIALLRTPDRSAMPGAE